MANRIGEKWRNEYETAKEHQVPEIIRKGYAATLEERYEISNEMSAGKTKLTNGRLAWDIFDESDMSSMCADAKRPLCEFGNSWITGDMTNKVIQDVKMDQNRLYTGGT